MEHDSQNYGHLGIMPVTSLEIYSPKQSQPAAPAMLFSRCWLTQKGKSCSSYNNKAERVVFYTDRPDR